MKKLAELSQEEKDEALDDLAELAAFAAIAVLTESGMQALEEFKKNVNNRLIELDKKSIEEAREEAVASLFDLLHLGAGLTNTKLDDKAVSLVERIYYALGSSKPFKEFLTGVVARMKERAEIRRARRAERKEKRANR